MSCAITNRLSRSKQRH